MTPRFFVYLAISIVIMSLALMAGANSYFHQPDFSVADVDY